VFSLYLAYYEYILKSFIKGRYAFVRTQQFRKRIKDFLYGWYFRKRWNYYFTGCVYCYLHEKRIRKVHSIFISFKCIEIAFRRMLNRFSIVFVFVTGRFLLRKVKLLFEINRFWVKIIGLWDLMEFGISILRR